MRQGDVPGDRGMLVPQGVKSLPAEELRTNAAYGTLPTADQVSGVVLPTDGLLVVWFSAMVKSAQLGQGRAAIFLGANQQKAPAAREPAPVTIAAPTSLVAADRYGFVCSCASGLVLSEPDTSAYLGSVTTGQAVAAVAKETNGKLTQEVNGIVENTGAGTNIDWLVVGGPCVIEAAAGTYDVSVQFKAGAGSVSAKERKLRVATIEFPAV